MVKRHRQSKKKKKAQNDLAAKRTTQQLATALFEELLQTKMSPCHVSLGFNH
jgi:hypothetical protein